jgi:hypothetical protein
MIASPTAKLHESAPRVEQPEECRRLALLLLSPQTLRDLKLQRSFEKSTRRQVFGRTPDLISTRSNKQTTADITIHVAGISICQGPRCR